MPTLLATDGAPAASDELVDTSATPEPPQSPVKLNAARLHGLFLGESDFYNALGPQVGETVRAKIAEQPNPVRGRQRVANTAFLADRMGLSAKDVAARYDTLRQSYAAQMFPDVPAIADEGVFFSAVRGQLQNEAQEAELMGEMNRRLFSAAIEGKDFGTAWEGMNIATATKADKKRADLYNAWAMQRWEENRTIAAKLSPVINRMAQFFADARGGKTYSGSDDLMAARRGVTEDLATLDPQERSTVMALAAERSQATEQRERGALQATVDVLGEGTADMVNLALAGLWNSADAIARAQGLRGPSDSAPGQRMFDRFQIERDLEGIVAGEVDPIKGDSFAGQIALDFTRSVPMMLAALTPAGLAVDFLALKQSARERLEAEGVAGPQAERLATVQAIPQTALFFASSKMVFLGKVPKAFGTSIPATLATEYVGNYALNEAGFLTDAGIQALAATFTEAVPEVDWQEFGRSFLERQPQQLAFAIPGALIGTGVATFKNKAAGKTYLQQPELMEDLGFTPEAKAEVMAAETPEAVETAFKRGFEERDIDSLAEIEAQLEREREAIQTMEPGVVFEALEVMMPDADKRLLRELEQLDAEMRFDEETLGMLAEGKGKPGNRRQRLRAKAAADRLEQIYLRRLEVQAELDVPGARDALEQYHRDVERAATPTRQSLVWEFVESRKLPTVKTLRELGSLGGEIAGLELPRRVFDANKRIGIDRFGQSLVDYLAESGDPDAAAMQARGEHFTEAETLDLIADAYQQFKARQVGDVGRVPVPKIEMPEVERSARAAPKPPIATRLSYRTERQGNEVTLYALHEGKIAGQATFAVQGQTATPVLVTVKEGMRRQGVATAIYNQFASQHPGVAIAQAAEQTKEGKAFRAAYKQPERAGVLPFVEQVRGFDGEGFRAWSKEQPGGFTATAHRVGLVVKSGAEVNSLLVAQAEAQAELDAAATRAKGGDMDAMNEAMLLSTKAQFFREAYEAALGELSAGQRLREQDPNFVPPITRNADGSYRVRTMDGAPSVTAATPEGAAMVEQAQRQEAAQQAATSEPEPRPEEDGKALPPRVTALNKEAIAALRELFGMDALDTPARERFLQVLDEAKRTEANKSADVIAADILATRRVASAAEHAALVLRSAELQNHYEGNAALLSDALARGDTAAAEQLQTVGNTLQAQLDTLTAASDAAGTAIARALSIRRMRLNRDDYTLARIVQRARSAKQGELTPEKQAEFQALTEQLAEQRRIVEEQRTALLQSDMALARASAETFVAEGRARRRAARVGEAAMRRRDLKRELLGLGMRVNDITSVIGLSFEQARLVAKIADTYIEEGVASLAELTNKLKADIPDLSDQDIYVAVGRQTKREAAKIESEAKRRVKELRAQAALWAKINAALEDKRPDGSPINRKQRNQLLRETLLELRRQSNRTTFDDAALRRVDAEIAEIQKHLAEGSRPAAPAEVRVPSEKLSAAKQILSELRQEMGALDTIEDLEAAIGEAQPKPAAEGKPALPPSPTEQRARLNTLRERIAELRDQIDAAQVDPAAVNAERLAKLQRLSAELETQLEEGFRVIPEGRRGVPETDQVAAARKQFHELQRLMRTEDSIADLEEQIRTREYKVSAPEQRIISNAKLEAALIRQRQLKRKVDQLIEEGRKKGASDNLLELLQTSRALVTTADMGGLFRQGAVLFPRQAFRRPNEALRTIVGSVRALLSENSSDAIAIALENHPLARIWEKAGLYLSDIGAALTAREEHFQSNWAERIPGWGRIVRASNRSMVTTLNLIRVSAFEAFMKAHPDATDAQKMAMARYINAASGRGNVKWNPATVKTMNAIFFAPRYTVSRFQTLYSPFKNWRDPVVRNEILKDFGAFVGTGLMVLTLAHMAGADVGLDPSESDFGKIIIGDTRIDIWGGLLSPVRLMLQAGLMPLQEAEAPMTDELSKEIDALEATQSFFKYKLSPAITVPYAFVKGENIIGQEQGRVETLVRGVAPLSIQEGVDVGVENEDVAAGLAAFGVGFVGIGVQQHK